MIGISFQVMKKSNVPGWAIVKVIRSAIKLSSLKALQSYLTCLPLPVYMTLQHRYYLLDILSGIYRVAHLKALQYAGLLKDIFFFSWQ